jgi:drug/metabolite transporter (DMT)-like permease
MATGRARNPWVAGLLSSVLPGLGQFYNRQWAKGVGFLLGVFGLTVVLSSSVDPKALEQAAEAGTTPDDLGLIFLLLVVILAMAVWSIADAVRIAKKS